LIRLEIKQFRGSYNQFDVACNSGEVCLKPSNCFAYLSILALEELLQVLSLVGKFCFHLVNARLEGLDVVTDVSPEAAVGVSWRANVLGEHATDARHDLCGSIQLILQARL